jgi:cytochrome c-type biogenesis protein CcmF
VWPWVLTAWLALTAGNGFGAVWAYKSFGWGGFWSWDPVENTSFVPWALCAVTVHSLWLSRGRGPWLQTAAYGALGGFLTVLYGSFLARSGLLAGASVHAYIGGERLFVWALGTLLVAGLILAVALLARAQPEWIGGEPASESPRLAPPGWGTRLLLGLAGLVLVGMSLPIVGGKPNTTAYDTAVLPFALGIMLMLAWPARWVRPSAEAWARGVVTAVFGLLVAAAVLSTVMSIEGGVPAAVGYILAPLLGLACLVALIQAVWAFLFARRRPWLRRGVYLAHLGLAALVLGALVAGYGSHTAKDQALTVGDETTVLGQQIKLVRVTRVGEKTIQADLTLNGQPGQISTEESSSFEMPLRHAWVLPRVWGDFYLTPTAIVPDHPGPDMQGMPPGLMFDFTVKPGMRLVWLGMWLIAAGIALALVRRTVGRRRPV